MAQYYDKYQKRGAIHWDWYETSLWYRRLVDNIIDHFKARPKGTILDIGCGDGFISYKLSFYHNVIGVDIDYTGIQLAMQKAKDQIESHNLDFYIIDYFALSAFIPIFNVDYIVLVNTIEHLEKPFNTLNEIIESYTSLEEILIVTDMPNARKSRHHHQEFTPNELLNNCSQLLQFSPTIFKTNLEETHGVLLSK